jgi:preprotein translocase subunit SecG
MVILLTIVHVIVCLFLVVVVLLQSGKAADLAGAFGGMGSQTVFGPRGAATVLSKATTIAATLFMITSLTLSIMATRAGKGSSTPDLLQKATKPVQGQKGPAAPPVQPGGSVPIDITPSVDGKEGKKQTVPVPVVPNGKQ